MQSKITFNKPRAWFYKTFMALSLLCLISASLHAQTFVNGNVGTGATSNNGTAAPAGTTWHELQNDAASTTESNGSLGLSHVAIGTTTNYSVADDFTVPAGQTWNISKLRIFAIDQVTAGTTSPYTNIRVRIHKGKPGVAGTTIAFGDLTTNRFASTAYTNKRAIFNSKVPTPTANPTPNLPIFSIDATINTSLTPGNYWVEWQVLNTANTFTITSQVVGIRTKASYNAIQSDAGSWTDLLDIGSPNSAPDVAVELPFELTYTATGNPCTADAPGATTTSAATVCPGTKVNLAVATPGGGIGISYQWQSSPNNTTFTDVLGAIDATFSPTITVGAWYRLKVTCAANASLYSTPVQVNLQTTGCYCAGGATSLLYEKISNVTFGGLNNSSTSTAGYEDFTGLTPVNKYEIGNSYPLSITLKDGYALDAVNVWIDLNGDGDFTDAGELIYESDLGAGPFTGVVQIPGNAVVGKTRMRVRLMDFLEVVLGSDTDGPCGINAYGQVEDYTVEITPCIPIAFPATGTTPSIECGATTTIAAGATGTAPVYQWQYRTSATGTWLPITNTGIYSGATTGNLTLTNVSQAYNNYQYRALASGFCAGIIFGPAHTLTVRTIVPVVSPAAPSICAGTIQKLTLTNTLSNTNVIDEGFGTFPPANWTTKNNSTPLGAGSWFQGNDAVFPAFDGAVNSYAGVNFQSVAGSNTISNWLFTPTVSIKNGDIFSFYTRTTGFPAEYADRLQVRLSTNGASTNVGTTNTSIGDFTTLLVEVNPNLTLTGYPGDWTKYTVTMSGITGTVSGKIAFRYFVTAGGPNGSNSDYIGIDRVVYTSIGGPAKGVWTSTHPASIWTDATATTQYVAGTPLTEVYVKPDSTRTYKVTYTTPTPCTSGETSVTVTVGHPITGTITAASKAVCVGGNVSFTSTAPTSGGIVNHQWKYSTNGGATWANVPAAAPYAGTTTNTLSITGATQTMNQYQFRDSLFVTSCNSNVLSTVATLTVNPLSTLVIAAAPTSTVYPSVTTSVVVAVNPVPAPSTTYAWTYNGTAIAGATTNTVSNIGIDQLGTYRVTVTDGNGCKSSASTVVGDEANSTLFIYPNPTTNGVFHVRYYDVPGLFGYQGKRTLVVFDSKGSKVYSKSYSPSGNYTDMVVDLSNHVRGIYTVDVLDNTGGRLKTGRVVVQ